MMRKHHEENTNIQKVGLACIFKMTACIVSSENHWFGAPYFWEYIIFLVYLATRKANRISFLIDGELYLETAMRKARQEQEYGVL